MLSYNGAFDVTVTMHLLVIEAGLSLHTCFVLLFPYIRAFYDGTVAAGLRRFHGNSLAVLSGTSSKPYIRWNIQCVRETLKLIVPAGRAAIKNTLSFWNSLPTMLVMQYYE